MKFGRRVACYKLQDARQIALPFQNLNVSDGMQAPRDEGIAAIAVRLRFYKLPS
jgi:hypothetical protein